MAAPTHVQAVSAQSSGNVTSITSPTFTSTSGNLLAACGVAGTAEGAAPYTDSKSNTWANAVAQLQNATANLRVSEWYAKNITGGAGHTVTYTSGGNEFQTIAVEEMAGADLVAPLDQHPAGQAPAAASNPHNCSAITPSVAGTLAVAVMSDDGGGSETFAATGTGTVQTSQTNTSFQPVALSTDTRSGTGVVTEGFNLTADNSVAGVMLVANFKGAAAASGSTHPIHGYGPN